MLYSLCLVSPVELMADWADDGRPNVANYPEGAAGLHPTWVGRTASSSIVMLLQCFHSILKRFFVRQRQRGYCWLNASRNRPLPRLFLLKNKRRSE